MNSGFKVITTLAIFALSAVYYHKILAIGKRVIDDAKTVSVSYDLTQFDRKLSSYFDMNGAAPRDIASFIRKEVTTSTGRDILSDVWGTRYEFKSFENGYLIRSAGPDRRLGTPDDLYILRLGDATDAHLSWFTKHEELAAQMPGQVIQNLLRTDPLPGAAVPRAPRKADNPSNAAQDKKPVKEDFVLITP